MGILLLSEIFCLMSFVLGILSSVLGILYCDFVLGILYYVFGPIPLYNATYLNFLKVL